ncbi:MAG: hypothetical protein HYX54_02150 [Chloroflexi bacterium]|nr:hypothetical protein [Chloroflexota bacterium]
MTVSPPAGRPKAPLAVDVAQGSTLVDALDRTPVDATGRPWPAFAHASEAEMARILDFYAVRWDYEPRTFPILWNLDGDVVESFSPDFYLPELDLYLEMTTLKQRLVRKKNRKLRRLRELYPAINIKLFYARDFRAMMLKYGRIALADSLSGTLGQISPDRSPGELVHVLADVLVTPSTAAIPSRPRRRDRRAEPPPPDVLVTTAPAMSGRGALQLQPARASARASTRIEEASGR